MLLLDYTYSLTTTGKFPLNLPDVKSYLKIENDADDDTLNLILSTAISLAEKYMTRDVRANVWTLVLDCFADRILLRKSEVASITSVKYSVATLFDTTVENTVYYLKSGHQFSKILLATVSDVKQVWPTDGLDRESGIEIVFATKIPRNIDDYKLGLLQNIAFLYQNRGDCDVKKSLRDSGAIEKYDRIERI